VFDDRYRLVDFERLFESQNGKDHDAGYNLALGAKRAQAAADYLIALGVAAHRLSVKSLGEEAQVCGERNEGYWQKNRHDRFVARAGKPGV